MANVMDYLDWRGDVPFSLSPVNEVDEFILGKLGTPDLRGIVPEDGSFVTVGRAAEAYRAGGGGERLGAASSRYTVPAFLRLPETERFGDVMLSGYRLKFSPEQTEQFSALTVRLPGGRIYVTFRGTDDSIVGWKENFQMAVMDTVPAQADALKYLLWAAETYSGELVVGGHSKGGNLAMYAAACAPEAVQERILRVYSNDGPGFQEAFLRTPGYGRIRHKLRTLVPENATVGTLLFQEGDFGVVRSEAPHRLSAHDGFTWETTPTGFVRCETLTPSARAFDKGMDKILTGMTMEQRREFIESFFGTIQASGAETLTDVTEQRLRQTLQMVRSLNQEPEVHRMVMELLETLIRGYAQERGVTLPRLRMPRRLRRKEREEPASAGEES